MPAGMVGLAASTRLKLQRFQLLLALTINTCRILIGTWQVMLSAWSLAWLTITEIRRFNALEFVTSIPAPKWSLSAGRRLSTLRKAPENPPVLLILLWVRYRSQHDAIGPFWVFSKGKYVTLMHSCPGPEKPSCPRFVVQLRD